MAGQIIVGCCGFPEARERYCQRFPVVELQSTFYQPPSLSLAQRWRRQAPTDFTFTMKAWQLITHPASSPTYRRLKGRIAADKRGRYGFFQPTDEVQDAWGTTLAVARILVAPVVVLQCPASFTPTPQHLHDMETFFGRIDREGLLLAWEPRGDWPPDLVSDLCRRLDLLHCVDPFVDRCQHGEIAYFRLHGLTAARGGKGGYRYRYTDEDLVTLAETCRAELSAGRLSVYVMFNNVYMLEDAQRFQAMVAR